MGLKPRLRPIESFVVIVGVILVVATSIVGANATRQSGPVAGSDAPTSPALHRAAQR